MNIKGYEMKLFMRLPHTFYQILNTDHRDFENNVNFTRDFTNFNEMKFINMKNIEKNYILVLLQ